MINASPATFREASVGGETRNGSFGMMTDGGDGGFEEKVLNRPYSRRGSVQKATGDYVHSRKICLVK